MSRVQIAAHRLFDARRFAELNGLEPFQWDWLSTAMQLRGRKPGVIYVVHGVDKAMNEQLLIWARYQEGKAHRVDPLTRVKFE
jgi:hypothetical protein